ncbi:MAG: bifunctional [glutamate--ammonia ligase]-adenylyl-L-tyrosine phosphorylase/[glutamate--ammonia-ligase] adenylyltransferase [Planctomycetia bacterium]|nr:bifunctional [glutamate--ammonia ligase]-adenylyl-L-tyrosine phosphorylase/[glutamate--ammonia-ligase] adenylyltransferase [Planctomycetia bacterium]
MDIDRLRQYLDRPAEAESWLQSWGVEDVRRAHANLVSMATAGVTLDLLAAMCDQLSEHLPGSSDADMALNNLDRFVEASRSPLALGSLFDRDREALGVLLQIFATSQHLSDLLIHDPGAYDLLRLTEGQPAAREVLVEELASEVAALDDEAAVLTALRRYKRRETLRIAYGDIIRGQNLATVTGQISYLADAIVESAVRFARRRLEEKRGRPRRADGQPARIVALGMGKLGGVELNYSSDIDLIFLYDADGRTDGARPLDNIEFFDRLVRDVVRLLTETTDLGFPYRVDLRLRPEGERGPLVLSLERAMHYYDVLGRTWERQAYVKARPVAGDLDLGREFLEYLEPWVYRRYLAIADITGIKALKRRIEQRTASQGTEAHDVKTGQGGIRDIEFVIQFLQLLNGADMPQLRTGNTLAAIAQLENTGCLTHQERSLLEENYGFLRKIEHRLQIMFDLQTHEMPTEPRETRRLAIRLGYADKANGTALAAFEHDYRMKTALNRKILDHLLHDAFGDDAQTEPEVDLVLDPDPPKERIAAVLGRYPFRDVRLAYKNLVALSTEKIRFLSTRRCRHFLASIAPRLLKAIAATPDPDSTLTNLEKVSDSLGGKGVLWELFSFNPPSMALYVEICSFSEFLSGLLISNPGMIDELMDSLVLGKLPTRADLHATLAELARGAEDLDPILHSFKNTQQLYVGVRSILGKEDIQSTILALTNIAEVCLERIALVEYDKLTAKLGTPTIGEGPRAGQPCPWAILGVGKLGGQELNYHSDLDVVFLYEADGQTVHVRRRQVQTTNNQHFFSELGQRIIKTASRLSAYGRLYEIDPRLRPTGRSGALATSFAEFERYFSEGDAQLWERQALTKARPVFGTSDAAARAAELAARAAYDHAWQQKYAEEIHAMRRRLEETAGAGNLKRGPGGIVDIEFLVQMLQLKHGRKQKTVRSPNTLAALAALGAVGILNEDDCQLLTASYRFLRSIECRLRLMNSTARDDLPSDPLELAKLAEGQGAAGAEALLGECEKYRAGNREHFDRLFQAAVVR